MLGLATPQKKWVSLTICATLWVYMSQGLRDAWFCARVAGAAFISPLPYNRCLRDDGVEADCCCEQAVAGWTCLHPTVGSRWKLKSLFACFRWFLLAFYEPKHPSPSLSSFHFVTTMNRVAFFWVLCRCMRLVQYCWRWRTVSWSRSWMLNPVYGHN